MVGGWCAQSCSPAVSHVESISANGAPTRAKSPWSVRPALGPRFAKKGHMDDTTKTGEAWRDEWCPTCRGNRQHHRASDGKWRCAYCHTEADAHAARRLDGAESNKRKQNNATVSN